MKKYNEKILKNIEEIMKKNKISQKELSKKLGLGNSALSTKFGRIEKGSTMTIKSLVEIAEALKIEPWKLLK